MTEVVQNFMQPGANKPNRSDEVLQADDDNFPEAIPLPECVVIKLENMCTQQTAEVPKQVSGMVHIARDGA